jgi:16S rRNA C967 or C1407 C5-methylase (RsmB/RsmF family)
LKEIWGKERAAPLGGGTDLRLSPHRHDTDGFFATVLRRLS